MTRLHQSHGELKRPLGPFEQILWLTDQWMPRHFSVVARIRGVVDAAAMRQALHCVQRRHPALRAAIEIDEQGCPRFVADDDAEVALRVSDRLAGDLWRDELTRELLTPVRADKPPLLRAALVRGPSASELILSVHHSIGDALAAAYLIRDLLRQLAGEDPREALPPRPSMEELLGLPHRGALLPRHWSHDPARYNRAACRV